MCGRAAQSHDAIRHASVMLGCENNNKDTTERNNQEEDNLNMSPGHSATVFQKRGEGNNIICAQKTWGLITRGGTPSFPLPHGSTKHFSTMMFNARSETASVKPSFKHLLEDGKSCVLAVDGFYEWKELEGRGKQPYYVHRKDHAPLYIAGLYTSVPTGHLDSNGQEEMLNTFTVLTTDACPKLTWLHRRQPLFLWDVELAKQWLTSSPMKMLPIISHEAVHTSPLILTWHPVTKKMSNVQYRGKDSNLAIKLGKTPSLKTFFQPKSTISVPRKEEQSISENKKRLIDLSSSSSPICSPKKRTKIEETPPTLPTSPKLPVLNPYKKTSPQNDRKSNSFPMITSTKTENQCPKKTSLPTSSLSRQSPPSTSPVSPPSVARTGEFYHSRKQQQPPPPPYLFLRL